MTFRQYVDHGWRLCRLKEGEKGPKYRNWNTPERAVAAAQAEHLPGAGLMHAFSGTCALDIDNLDLTRAYLAERGVDIDALLQAPDSVGISSGTENRAKLLFTLDTPLPTKKIVTDQKLMLFELRCADASGLTSVQDVLPPSKHPSGTQYRWVYGDELTGDWRSLPPLPDALRAFWLSLAGPATTPATTPATAPADHDAGLVAVARRIIAEHNPDCDHDTWIKLGMALENDLGETGWRLWHEWSAKGQKYPGEAALQARWDSFGRNPNPITLGAFRRQLIARREDFEDLTLAAPEGEDPFDALNEAAQQNSLKLWTLEEIQNRPWPEWTVLDVLPRAEINMIFGESGVGKSAIVLDMAMAIARGVRWFEHDVEQGTVVWLAAEAFGSMKPRTRAYAMHNGVEWDDLKSLPFHVVEQFNLNDEVMVQQLTAAAAPLKPAVVVVDTLAAATGGANENSGEDMGKVLDACRAIYHGTGASVLLIHHSGKNAELGARGWSGIKAAVQAELKVAFDEVTSQRVFTSTKQRDGESGIAYGFSLEQVLVGEDAKGRPVNSVAVKFNGKIEEPPPIEGDGAGRAPPKGGGIVQDAWEIIEEMAGAAGWVGVQEARAAINATMPAPEDGERDRRKEQTSRAVMALIEQKYIKHSDGRFTIVDGDPDDAATVDADSGEDLV